MAAVCDLWDPEPLALDAFSSQVWLGWELPVLSITGEKELEMEILNYLEFSGIFIS